MFVEKLPQHRLWYILQTLGIAFSSYVCFSSFLPYELGRTLLCVQEEVEKMVHGYRDGEAPPWRARCWQKSMHLEGGSLKWPLASVSQQSEVVAVVSVITSIYF